MKPIASTAPGGGVKTPKNIAFTDDEARRQYLGGMRFDAILRGDADGGLAATPA